MVSGIRLCMRYTDTNSSVSEYGAPSGVAPLPGMPLMMSLVLERRPTSLVIFSPGDAPPVGVHADLQGRVGEDSGRPFDRVDFGHEG
jgi:hypothetical protein